MNIARRRTLSGGYGAVLLLLPVIGSTTGAGSRAQPPPLNWTSRSPIGSPSGRLTAIAYDSARDRCVLFGGKTDTGCAVCNDTWEWDGSTWTQRSPAMSP